MDIYTHYNMNWPWKDYAKWKIREIKIHMLYDSTYMIMSTIGKSIEAESRLVVARGWGVRGIETDSWVGVSFGIMKMFWN